VAAIDRTRRVRHSSGAQAPHTSAPGWPSGRDTCSYGSDWPMRS